MRGGIGPSPQRTRIEGGRGNRPPGFGFFSFLEWVTGLLKMHSLFRRKITAPLAGSPLNSALSRPLDGSWNPFPRREFEGSVPAHSPYDPGFVNCLPPDSPWARPILFLHLLECGCYGLFQGIHRLYNIHGPREKREEIPSRPLRNEKGFAVPGGGKLLWG